tara:strand:- start:752 stop:949 length:198 start_codon:yes stop_codon:yes gene_type:complete
MSKEEYIKWKDEVEKILQKFRINVEHTFKTKENEYIDYWKIGLTPIKAVLADVKKDHDFLFKTNR